MYKVLDQPVYSYLSEPDLPEDISSAKRAAWHGDYRRAGYYRDLTQENKDLVASIEVGPNGINYQELSEITGVSLDKMRNIMHIIPGQVYVDGVFSGENKQFYNAAIALVLYIYQ